MSGSRPLQSLFDFAGSCGLARVSADMSFEYDSPQPCDSCLRKLVNQSARLVVSKCRREFADFDPSSNYGALLALCWLVAKFSLPELMLEEVASALGTPKQKRGKEETKQRAEGTDALGSIGDECKQIAFMSGRLLASMKCLSASTQQLMSLMHQVHHETTGISLSEDMNHLTLSQVGQLASSGGAQKFQAEIQRAFQATTCYMDWKKDEPEFWTWIESETLQTTRVGELENFKTRVEEMRSEVDFGTVATRPKLVLQPSTNSSLAQMNAEIRPKLAVVEKELALKRNKIRKSLTDLGLQYQAATFMP